ncbi:F0F1 ATP synthase subunit delta [Gilvimarinus agarilyticus]|uniref:F0F1 ATP synthase subunit delta n=1 Tax=Gilvimarinus sp. 2_MG-2023 TaxID=3062666 RepID=UPI001C0808C6|nr:F0F1 ATP synthase subunit delta [Gilvimarinus sp. 2_MG-2023]MBU2884198.1 F0F1 ATP synthase subunit delta [Gilvimarinus agarilyticus]MDO6569337.1 F0F1 ATP synthase subunit delta [Gilvimarinus sp. 2_MG-2023]
MAELTTLARPYAKAAFTFARDHSDLAGWATQLKTLALVSEYGKAKEIVASPGMTPADQAAALIEVCGEQLSEKVQNFVQLLADNKRLALLPEVFTLFDALKTAQEQAVDVELTTAFELDDASQQKLADALSAKLERKVKVSTITDQQLLGGVVIKAGDLVIDGSMRGRLEKLAKAINS